MEFAHYFQSADEINSSYQSSFKKNQLGDQIKSEVESLKDVDLVLFDIAEDRNSIGNKGTAKSGQFFREHLYKLHKGDYQVNILDLGTLKAGNTPMDTYFAVKQVVMYIMKCGAIPIIIGGSADLTYANYLAYAENEQTVNLVSIDASFPLGETDDQVNSENYLSKILFHQPNNLFNFSNIGHQSYFIDHDELRLLNELFYDNYRLGKMSGNIQDAEPILRNADFISFNINSIAQQFAPAHKQASPNGYSAAQACQLAKYAGMSDKLSSIGLYDFNPEQDIQGTTAHLLAQIIWHFIDGFYNRLNDFPKALKKEYTKYTVHLEEHNEDIVFYKSPKSDRWWMEVPYHSNISKRYKRHLMLPCTYNEYQFALEGEIPERWFQTFQKLK